MTDGFISKDQVDKYSSIQKWRQLLWHLLWTLYMDWSPQYRWQSWGPASIRRGSWLFWESCDSVIGGGGIDMWHGWHCRDLAAAICNKVSSSCYKLDSFTCTQAAARHQGGFANSWYLHLMQWMGGKNIFWEREILTNHKPIFKCIVGIESHFL